MGYESQLFIADRYDNGYMNVIASFNLCKMGYGIGFHELFKEPVGRDIWMPGIGDEIEEDMYGAELKHTDINTVIEWLETYGVNIKYRRITPLLNLLKGFEQSEWEDLRVIHYGHQKGERIEATKKADKSNETDIE